MLIYDQDLMCDICETVHTHVIIVSSETEPTLVAHQLMSLAAAINNGDIVALNQEEKVKCLN